jgi:lysozyme
MNLALLKEELKRDEGLRLKPYKCTAGAWTIGYGHNLSADGLSTEQVIGRYGTGISLEKAEALLNADMDDAIYAARSLCSGFWDQLTDARQRVVVNMAFNLGYTKLSQFKRTFTAIRECRYKDASRHMLNSRWYGQVGDRAKRLIAMMERGT